MSEERSDAPEEEYTDVARSIIMTLHRKIISIALIATKLVISAISSPRSGLFTHTFASRTIMTDVTNICSTRSTNWKFVLESAGGTLRVVPRFPNWSKELTPSRKYSSMEETAAPS